MNLSKFPLFLVIRGAALAIWGGAQLSACSPAASCVAGQSIACACTDGRSGVQVCSADGSYGACTCSSSPDMAQMSVPAHRFVFVTKMTYRGGVNGISGVDSLCATAARLAKLPGIYKAWVAGTGVNALDRMTSGDPWYLPPTAGENGVGPLAFANRAALVSGPAMPLDRDEYGDKKPTGTRVWTGASPDGTAGMLPTCSSWTVNSGSGVAGSTSDVDFRWTYREDFLPCSTSNSFYCFQQE